MKNTFGNNVAFTLFGESHGEGIGGVLDGLGAGVKIDESYIEKRLTLRRPSGRISTSRAEKDEYSFISGVFEGYTTGTPIAAVIKNSNVHSSDYSEMKSTARPGHADFTGYAKYNGYNDYRGGGHFSGRLTAALVLFGAIAQKALEDKGIILGTHVSRCAGISDAPFTDYGKEIPILNDRVFAVLDPEAGKKMTDEIQKAADDGDSVGGILETAVTGLPAGLGEPFFDTVEGMLSHALFAIPGVKGVEFGDGFALCDMKGSESNDPFCVKDGEIKTKTNRMGGINGGITNGMPVVFRTAIKPTPSIFKEQDTVDFRTGEEIKLSLKGRHDPAIVHRARAVQDAVASLVLADMLVGRYGSDFFGGDGK